MVTINIKNWNNKYVNIQIKTDREVIETGISKYKNTSDIAFEILNKKGYNVPQYSFKYNKEIHETVIYNINKKVNNKKDLIF